MVVHWSVDYIRSQIKEGLNTVQGLSLATVTRKGDYILSFVSIATEGSLTRSVKDAAKTLQDLLQERFEEVRGLYALEELDEAEALLELLDAQISLATEKVKGWYKGKIPDEYFSKIEKTVRLHTLRVC